MKLTKLLGDADPLELLDFEPQVISLECGDVIIAEPKALVGFAGPRVIQQTIRQELPEGFQRAEFLLKSGLVDRVVPRAQLRSEIARIIDYSGK